MVSKTFVGREYELEELEKYLTDVLQNKKGNVTFITGEVGSGKTELVQQFASKVLNEHPEIRFANSKCYAVTGEGEPYLPFFALLGELVITEKKKGKDRFLKILEDVGPDWVQAIPLVGSLIAAGLKTAVQVKKEFSSREILLTVFQQYTKALQNISELNPLLLIIDDLQWSDSSSCSLLSHLARNIENYPIFIMATYCASEIKVTSHPLKRIRAKMDIDKLCNGLSLKRFSKGNLTEYLKFEFPNNLFEPSFIDLFDDKTGGNPLFIAEVVNLLKEQKILTKENNLWKLSQHINDIDIPTNVAGVINNRIDLLKDESKQRILRYGSVQGEKFNSVCLSKSLDRQELSLLEELDILEKIHKLIEELEMEGLITKMGAWYQFIHYFIHQSFYNSLSKREKVLLHEKIGNILEEQYQDDIKDVVGDLAVHFEEGEVYDKAVDYRLKSAKKANAIYSSPEAIKHCKRGLTLLEKLEESEENIKKKIEILFELGRGEKFIGGWDKAVEYYTEAKKLAEKTNTENYIGEGYLREIKTKIYDGKGLAETLSDLGYIYSRQKKFSDILSKLEHCLEINKEHSDFIGMASTLRIKGFTYRNQHKFSEALEALNESVECCEKANSRQEKAETLREKAVIYGEQGNHKEELLVCEEILQIDEKLGNILGKIHTLKLQAWANRLLGNLPKAAVIFEERLNIARKTCNPREIAEALQGVALIYRDIGKWEESIACCKEYIKISDELDSVPRHTIYNDLGFIYRRQGKFDEAIKKFEKEIELRTKMDDKTRKMWLTEIGKVYYYQGKLDQALSLYEEAFKVAKERQKASILWKMGEVYEAKGLLDKALEIYNESRELIKEQSDILRTPVLLTKIGGVYLLQGEYELSKKTLEEALSKRFGEKHGEAITYHNLSRLYLSKGELDKAMKYIDKAIAIFYMLKAFRFAGAKLTKAKIYLKKRDYQKARVSLLIAREKFTELRIPHGIAETEMLEGELIYAENGDIRQANSLVSKASEVFRDLRFKLLENESAIMRKKFR
jgi:tetratricopeptide (TPR) repeat protein